MIQVQAIPKDKQFSAVWEFGGGIWANSFIFAGVDEDGNEYYDPFSIENDSFDESRRGTAFFVQYPHQIFVADEV